MRQREIIYYFFFISVIAICDGGRRKLSRIVSDCEIENFHDYITAKAHSDVAMTNRATKLKRKKIEKYFWNINDMSDWNVCLWLLAAFGGDRSSLPKTRIGFVIILFTAETQWIQCSTPIGCYVGRYHFVRNDLMLLSVHYARFGDAANFAPANTKQTQ